MLDIKFIRENPKIVKKAVIDKQYAGTVDIDKLLSLDKQYMNNLRKVELHRSLHNNLSKDISKVDKDARSKLVEEATKIKTELVTLEQELKAQKDQINQMMLWVPNPPASDVPFGKDETGDVVYKTVGEIKKFDFE